MLFTYIFLHNSTLQQDLPIGLALCLVPAVLAWFMAFLFYKVSDLRQQIKDLTDDKTRLQKKVDEQAAEITDLRVKLTQAESEIYTQTETIQRLNTKIILLENELSAYREKKKKD